jgi:hypothetical protein
MGEAKIDRFGAAFLDVLQGGPHAAALDADARSAR